MKKAIAFGLALFIALVGFQMTTVKAFAADKGSSLVLNDEKHEKKDEKKKDEKKHD